MTASFQKPISLGSATSATTRSSAAPAWRRASSAAIACATPAAPRIEPVPAILFSPWSAISPSVPNPRIHHRVRNVREEIERDRQDGDQHDDPEDYRVVAVDRGLKREQAHSRPAENSFRDDRPAHELRCLQRYQGDDRQDGVAKRVLVVDGAS